MTSSFSIVLELVQVLAIVTGVYTVGRKVGSREALLTTLVKAQTETSRMVRETSEKLGEFVLSTEKRLTALETRMETQER